MGTRSDAIRALVRFVASSTKPWVQGPVTLLSAARFYRALYVPDRGQFPSGAGAVNLSFDIDFRADVESLPRILASLSDYPFKASFAVVGRWLEEYPDLHRQIVSDGHEVVNHSYSHPNNAELNPDRYFSRLSEVEMVEEIRLCHEACERLLGVEPRAFRTPHFGNLHTNAVYPILRRLGYRYCSAQVAVRVPTFGRPYRIDGIWEFPVATCPRHPFAVFDTWHAFRPGGGRHRNSVEFQHLFRQLIDTARAGGKYASVYFDPCLAASLDVLRPCLDHLLRHNATMPVMTFAAAAEQLESTERLSSAIS